MMNKSLNKILARQFLVIMMSFFYVSMSAWTTMPEPAVANKDYTLHTLFIFNFMKYAEWPEKRQVFKIGIVDNKEAEGALTKMAKLKSNADQSIVVSNTTNTQELNECQIVFIPENHSQEAEKIITGLKSRPTLIITEEAGLIKKGAAISFKIVDAKLKFQVNEEAIRSSGLKLSTAILSLAEK